MGDIYSRIAELCKSNGISGYKLCKEIGMQPSILTDMKMGRQSGLSAKNVDLVAKYFGVSSSFILTGEQKETPVTDNDDELNEYLEMLRTRPECRILMKTVKGATKAEVEENVRFIEALRQAKGND